MFEPWVPFLKSKGKFRMNRIAVFTLLAALNVSWSIPAKAQGTGVAEYVRQSRKANKRQPRNIGKHRKNT